MSELKNIILKTGSIKDNIGHYIQDILKEYSFESLCGEFKGLLLSGDLNEFDEGIGFISFLKMQSSYIPGDEVFVFLDKMRETGFIKDVLCELMQKKLYSQINTILSISDCLPVEFSVDELREFLERYKVENPIILDSVFRAITVCCSKVFPEDEFKALSFEDKNIEFTVKYLIASIEFIDPFVRDEYFRMIDGMCPDKLRDSFNEAVSENRIFLMDESDMAEVVPEDVTGEKEMLLDSLPAIYFDSAEKDALSGKILSYPEFLEFFLKSL